MDKSKKHLSYERLQTGDRVYIETPHGWQGTGTIVRMIGNLAVVHTSYHDSGQPLDVVAFADELTLVEEVETSND